MWIAVLAGALAAGLVAWAGVGAWRAFQRVRLTHDAALALLDVHQAKLDATIAAVSDNTGKLADTGEELGEALAELRRDATHLKWVLGRIPEAQGDLRRELIDLLLPTGARKDDDDDG
ncbi:MAG: hypothetical protein JWO69_176 [Thermoleophilia bacterium]|jgi:hypothetical protein|nr:hypothetical protein [Thermoleophilia bacterium]